MTFSGPVALVPALAVPFPVRADFLVLVPDGGEPRPAGLLGWGGVGAVPLPRAAGRGSCPGRAFVKVLAKVGQAGTSF